MKLFDVIVIALAVCPRVWDSGSGDRKDGNREIDTRALQSKPMLG